LANLDVPLSDAYLASSFIRVGMTALETSAEAQLVDDAATATLRGVRFRDAVTNRLPPFSHGNPARKEGSGTPLPRYLGSVSLGFVIRGKAIAAFAMPIFAAIPQSFASDLAGHASVIDGETKFMGRAYAIGIDAPESDQRLPNQKV
jgi:hypothetical protein